MDGADQTKIALPISTTSVKDQCGHCIAFHLVGLRRHGAIENLWLFTIMDDHDSGANHIIESVDKQISKVEDKENGLLPSFQPGRELMEGE